DGLFGYLPPRLSEAMSAACAEWQAKTYGWSVDASQVHPIPDVIKGLEIAIEHFSRPGSPVIVPVPAYMPFLKVPTSLGRRIIRVPLAETDGRYSFDLEALGRAFDEGGHLLVLCNPYNPVGRVFSPDELTAVSDLVAAHDGRVFSDEIHAPLVFPGGRHVPYASVNETSAAHTITATSASKAWNLPGLKCAQLIITNDADARTWEELGPFAGHGTANPGVVANTAAYTSGRPWLDEVIGYLDRNRALLSELLAEELPMISYSPPEGTYIGWLDCRELERDLEPGVSAADFFAEQAGVALTDGEACGTPGFVRMIFATPAPVLTQAVRRMGAAVREHVPAR
ncbi:MAG: aminotransferase class I/II-fold pyridoxal phosphate-dependent enzyme, partial [Microlunatus sp.]|nr:aminotransferase class I/II-fold pyridoxal phosphate-dependent enzyme [Microlunatus sp.]